MWGHAGTSRDISNGRTGTFGGIGEATNGCARRTAKDAKCAKAKQLDVSLGDLGDLGGASLAGAEVASSISSVALRVCRDESAAREGQDAMAHGKWRI
jgi:hypothetical protein